MGRGAVKTVLQLPGKLSLPAVLYHMPAPGSYTGEDVVEIHLPGSPPVLRLLVDTLLDQGASPAKPGEFTQRAYLHGRMDLVQAEAVQSLIQSRNLEEVRAARQQLEGGLSSPLSNLEGQLIDLCAEVEASIDFVEQDIEIIPQAEIVRRLDLLRDQLENLLRQSRLEAGSQPIVALYGPPNAGKSTLFNRLTRGDAIVSDQAGTTRDVLAGEMDSIRILDLAGEQVATGVDGEAVHRARQVRDQADLVLLVVDAIRPEMAQEFSVAGRPVIFVVNKTDLVEDQTVDRVCQNTAFVDRIGISAKTGDGVDELRQLLRIRLVNATQDPAARFQVSVRQQAHLRQAAAALEEAHQTLQAQRPVELLALDLRTALESLGGISGRHVSEEILDRIFSRFCLGK